MPGYLDGFEEFLKDVDDFGGAFPRVVGVQRPEVIAASVGCDCVLGDPHGVCRFIMVAGPWKYRDVLQDGTKYQRS